MKVELFERRLSVVIPCFNCAATVKRSVDSILSQTISPLEIILVDDGSNDGVTPKILTSLADERLRIVTHEKNRGLPAARNTGFDFAMGDFVMFLDADDWYTRDAIQRIAEYIPIHESKYFTYTDVTYLGNRVGDAELVFRPFSQLIMNKIPYSILLRKDLITWRPVYDESFRTGLEDWDLNLKLLEEGFTPIRVPSPLFNYQVSEEGMFQSLTLKNYKSLFLDIRKKHPILYSHRSILRRFAEEVKLFGILPPIKASIVLGILIVLPKRLIQMLLVSNQRLNKKVKKYG